MACVGSAHSAQRSQKMGVQESTGHEGDHWQDLSSFPTHSWPQGSEGILKGPEPRATNVAATAQGALKVVCSLHVKPVATVPWSLPQSCCEATDKRQINGAETEFYNFPPTGSVGKGWPKSWPASSCVQCWVIEDSQHRWYNNKKEKWDAQSERAACSELAALGPLPKTSAQYMLWPKNRTHMSLHT